MSYASISNATIVWQNGNAKKEIIFSMVEWFLRVAAGRHQSVGGKHTKIDWLIVCADILSSIDYFGCAL